MEKEYINIYLERLKELLEGDLYYDYAMRLLYATDASVYWELPLAVARPKTITDIKRIIAFAREHKTSVIPRTAGTSLAGQVVGKGIVIDMSKYFTNVLEVNASEKWVRVEPGVVLDELNLQLRECGLFFGPETSTSNRCMLGGMVGNNACGAHSIIYGSTRDHTLSVKGILSDGSDVEFSAMDTDDFFKKCEGNTLENRIYRHIRDALSLREVQDEIRKEYPDKTIHRRNTGYALDLLLETELFTPGGKTKFNFSTLIAGSEGTLMFITEIKLNLAPLPPREKSLMCAHFSSIEDAFKANLVALKHSPCAVELMDKTIMNCTKGNIGLQKNRFFIQGDPGAVLIIEFACDTREEIENSARHLEADFKRAGYGYHFPLVFGPDIQKVWDLRKAGLGVLSNVDGGGKAVTVIEDTAVNPEVLPDYIAEFNRILHKHGLACVYYAHAGSGELHLRPVLDLKKEKDAKLFHTIALEIAWLVKRYRGSLSGEHGDGRLRGEFIPLMLGEKIYQLLKQLKSVWDPENIFNPGKITDTPSMMENLRYDYKKQNKPIETFFNFSGEGGVLAATEKCTGSADCRKSEIIGGIMCPSYMATKDENASTRARANILREFLTNSVKKNPFDHKEIYDILDLCLSCKACKSECPSSVDMAKLKAEFLQHYYDANGVPFRSWLIANTPKINNIGIFFPRVFNFFTRNKVLSCSVKALIGFARERQIPLLHEFTFRRWIKKNLKVINTGKPEARKIYLFVDEFTNYNDVHIGIKTIRLLSGLGYRVVVPEHTISGRTYLSKGLVREAKRIALRNVLLLKDIVTEATPLVGIEPSAILTFRDEYPELVSKELQVASRRLAKNAFMVDEFIAGEIEKGYIRKEQFTTKTKEIKLHGHCQQKAVASTEATRKILSFPENYSVQEIKSGCCGMAGSFGFEKEHYDLSMKVGELILFPEIRKTSAETLVAATGTSCRHQIKDGAGRHVLHPVEILYEALNK